MAEANPGRTRRTTSGLIRTNADGSQSRMMSLLLPVEWYQVLAAAAASKGLKPGQLARSLVMDGLRADHWAVAGEDVSLPDGGGGAS